MPKPSPMPSIAAQVESLQASLAALEAQIAPLKAERDAHLKKHRAVYETERKYADKIKALQEQVTPLWDELKALRKLIAGPPQ